MKLRPLGGRYSVSKTMTEPILTARGVTKKVRDGQRDVAILEEIDLEISGGERVALVGPSGSGKSTLLHILGALDPSFEGSVTIGGRTLAGMGDGQRARLRNEYLGFVFQAYNLLGHLSVLENVLLPARFAPEAPCRERGYEVLARVGLADKGHRRPDTLSGGERQRVAIARALYHRPHLVLCDEPTGNLDRQTSREILELFTYLERAGTTSFIASHDPDVADTASRVLTIERGRLV